MTLLRASLALILLPALLLLGSCDSSDDAGITLAVTLSDGGVIGVVSGEATPISARTYYLGTKTLGYSFDILSFPASGGAVLFDPANSNSGGAVPSTDATFTGPGQYTLQVTVYEVGGFLSAKSIAAVRCWPSSSSTSAAPAGNG